MAEWDPHLYESGSLLQFTTAMSLFNQLKIEKRDIHVLDIGCGNGKITSQIANLNQVSYVIGIDLSESMIEHSKKKYVNPKVCFQVMDACHMNFYKEFDLVVSFWTLSWVHDFKMVLKGITKSLKEGGEIFLQIPLFHSFFIKVMSVVASNPKWVRYFCDLSTLKSEIDIEYYINLLKEGKFEKLCVAKERLHYVFENSTALSKYILTWLTQYLTAIPDNLNGLADDISCEYQSQSSHYKIPSLEINFDCVVIKGKV